MTSNRKISFFTKFFYGLGQLAEGIKNASFNLFALFFYNQVLGLSGTLCGIALAIALIFDAATDPLAGSISDNFHSRYGRRHPFMYASAIPLALCFYGLFNPPVLSQTGIFFWLVSFAILTRAAMTLYHVPHLALGAEFTHNFEERTSVVGIRTAFGFLGGLIAVIIAFGIFFVRTEEYVNGQLNPTVYAPMALIFSVLMFVTIWLSAIGTHHEIRNLPSAPKNTEKFGVRRVLNEMLSGLSNHSFRWLFAGVIIIFFMVGVDFALNLYVNTFFWEFNASQMLLFQMAFPIGLILGTTLTRKIHARFDKKPGVIFGTLCWAILQVLPVCLRLLDLLPENGDSFLVVFLVGMRFIQGAGAAQSIVSYGSMLGDITDEHELKTGKRQEGMFFGASSFSVKATSGLGTLFGGIGLDLISWPTGDVIKTASDIPSSTIVKLGVLYGPVLAAFGIIAVWCVSHYNISRSRHQEIVSQLEIERKDRNSP